MNKEAFRRAVMSEAQAQSISVSQIELEELWDGYQGIKSLAPSRKIGVKLHPPGALDFGGGRTNTGAHWTFGPVYD